MSTRHSQVSMLQRVEEFFDKMRSSAKDEQNAPGGFSRRNFLQLGGVAGAAASLVGLGPAPSARPQSPPQTRPPDDLNEATIADLQRMMAVGDLTSISLVNFYLHPIPAP